MDIDMDADANVGDRSGRRHDAMNDDTRANPHAHTSRK
jgi:hypothetical protein